MENPDLLPPGFAPSDPRGQTVPPLARFRSRDEFGNLVESTKPYPTQFVEEWRYYYCPVPNASMHRKDGKRLGFVNGVFATNIKADIDHLDAEIADGHPALRHATEAEIHGYKMFMDPKGTLRDQVLNDPTVRAQLEEELRGKLENEIRAKIAAEMGMDVPAAALSEGVMGAADASKLAGTSVLDKLKNSIKTPTATIVPSSPPGATIKPVSTADIVGAAKGN